MTISREENRAIVKVWRKQNPEKVREQNRRHKEKYYFEIMDKLSVWKKERYSSDPNYKLSIILRTRFYKFIKKESKSSSVIQNLGCTIDELKLYIEGQFQQGMTWGNWALHGWHIDHKIPLSSFDLTKPEEQRKAFHYTNLQPLWAEENWRKSNKLLANN